MDSPIPETQAASDTRCPRCGGTFHCGMSDTVDSGRCACATLTLAAALRTELAARYQGCLCLACLRALAAGEAPVATSG